MLSREQFALSAQNVLPSQSWRQFSVSFAHGDLVVMSILWFPLFRSILDGVEEISPLLVHSFGRFCIVVNRGAFSLSQLFAVVR